MRIALVTTRFPPDSMRGGIITLYENLAYALKRAGHEVLVLCYSGDEESCKVQDGIRVCRFGLPHGEFQLLKEVRDSVLPGTAYVLENAYKLASKSWPILEEFKPDVIEAPEYCAMGLFFALRRQYPVVIKGVGPLSYFATTGDIGRFNSIDQHLIRAVESAAMVAADGLSSISIALSERLSEISTIPVERFRTIKMPLDVPDIEPKPVRDSGYFPDLLYWGRIERQKGCDLLIEAFTRVAARFPNARLSLAGLENIEEGADRPYADTLRERLSELGLSDRVRFLGVLDHEEIRTIARLSDLAVFPSRFETAGYVLLEAISYGTVVLSTVAGGIPEYVEHGKSAWLVPPNDADALAEGMIRLIEDEQLRGRLQAEAPQLVRETCGYEEIAQQCEAFYRDAIEHFRQNPELDPAVAHLLRLVEAALETASDGEPGPYVRGKAKGWEEAGAKCYDEGFQEGYAAGLAAGGKPLSAAALKTFIKQKLLARK